MSELGPTQDGIAAILDQTRSRVPRIVNTAMVPCTGSSAKGSAIQGVSDVLPVRYTPLIESGQPQAKLYGGDSETFCSAVSAVK